jgi:hypothetical protein
MNGGDVNLEGCWESDTNTSIMFHVYGMLQ